MFQVLFFLFLYRAASVSIQRWILQGREDGGDNTAEAYRCCDYCQKGS